MKMYELFLTCPKGLENACKKELYPLFKGDISIHEGGISFKGHIEDIYKINLYSRVGMALLVKVLEFDFTNINNFYNSIYDYNWQTLIHVKNTFSINTNIIKRNSFLDNSQFVSLKIKDAICDRIRKSKGKRPEIDKKNPEISIRSIVNSNTCTIYLNSSGNPLYIRGYKKNNQNS